jgi:hypothetical protein
MDRILVFCYATDVLLNLMAHSYDWFRPFFAKITNIFDLAHMIITLGLMYLENFILRGLEKVNPKP